LAQGNHGRPEEIPLSDRVIFQIAAANQSLEQLREAAFGNPELSSNLGVGLRGIPTAKIFEEIEYPHRGLHRAELGRWHKLIPFLQSPATAHVWPTT
jgi:hypothetical protein